MTCGVRSDATCDDDVVMASERKSHAMHGAKAAFLEIAQLGVVGRGEGQTHSTWTDISQDPLVRQSL